MPSFDPKIQRLAELLDVSSLAATGLRATLWGFVVDSHGREDATEVSASEWALALGCTRDGVDTILDGFVAAGYLEWREGRLLVSSWQSVRADESAAAFRGWLRSNPGGLARFGANLADRGLLTDD